MYKINSLIVFVPRDILDFYFRDDDLLNAITLRPDDLRSLNVQDRRYTRERRTYQGLIAIQTIDHEKPTLEARKVTKLLRRDTTPSNDEFPSYVRSITRRFTRATPPPVENDTLDLYREGATLSKFIHEGKPTTTKRLSLLFNPSDEPIRQLYGLPGEAKQQHRSGKSRLTGLFNLKSIG